MTSPRAIPSTGTADGSLSAMGTAELASRLRLSSTRLVRRLRQESETGLPLSALSALAVIAAHGPMTLGALAELEGVTPPTVTRIVQRLEGDGLIERSTDVEDKRIKFVEMTSAGRSLLERSRERRNAWMAQQLSSLPPEEIVAIEHAVRLMERFTSEAQSNTSNAGTVSTPTGKGEL